MEHFSYTADGGVSPDNVGGRRCFVKVTEYRMNDLIFIAIRLKIQTKSSHKIHRSELLRLDFVNLNSWIAIVVITLTHHKNSGFTELKVVVVYLSPACGWGKI
ncbi:hypothetical protein [Ruminococcus sp.]|uniref:hypothetical protein n=1 Tax=Ruminococcus sp. TaxID=41978 RepID=UPI001AFFC8C2|nr:hypothetical protein [Ruminococcus sp.]MBO5559007.1 hypothetical protein [Ruminococcus sp.]